MFSPRKSVDHGTKTVNGTLVQITQLIWPDGGSSFEVIRVADEEELTSEGCFDDYPTCYQIKALMEEHEHRKLTLN